MLRDSAWTSGKGVVSGAGGTPRAAAGREGGRGLPAWRVSVGAGFGAETSAPFGSGASRRPAGGRCGGKRYLRAARSGPWPQARREKPRAPRRPARVHLGGGARRLSRRSRPWASWPRRRWRRPRFAALDLNGLSRRGLRGGLHGARFFRCFGRRVRLAFAVRSRRILGSALPHRPSSRVAILFST